VTTILRIAAAAAGGVLYGLPFFEPPLAVFAFVGLAPALFVLATGDGGFRRVLGSSFVAAAAAGIMIGLPLVTISVVALFIQGGMKLAWPLSALVLFAVLRRRTGWPIGLLWPCCWVLCEWSWSFHSIGRMPFGLSGYTQFIYPRLIQFAELTGVLGVSFLVQAVVGSLAGAAVAWASAPTGSRCVALRSPGALVPAIAAGTAIVLALAHGTARMWNTVVTPGPRVALIQPAITHDLDIKRQRLVQYRQMALAETLRPGEVDLVVFPENAVLHYIEDSPFLPEFRDLSRRLATPLLVGVLGRPRALPKDGFYDLVRMGNRTFEPATNSAAIITRDGVGNRYDKIHLIPFSEKVPAEHLFNWLGMLDGYRRFIVGTLGYIGMTVPGREVQLLRIPGRNDAPFWTPICFEQIDTDLAREAARRGARFFVNITSEGDLGSQIYWNTLAVAVLRAIELRVGVARCGNVGISGIIDPWGRQTHHLRGRTGALFGEAGVLKARVPLGDGRATIYARAGDWPAGLSGGMVALALIAGLRRRRRG
jgi:apolipoprotein N-acyltransferase